MSKRNCISLEQKRLIIIEVEKGVKKKKEIAAQFGIPSNTLSTILKNKAQLLKQSDGEQLGSNRKRVRTCLYEDVDEAMLNWTVAARKRNIPLTGPIMKERAKDVAEALGHLEFEASAGWLDKFKKRHGIVEKTFCGDCASIKVPDKWFKKVLPNLIHKYDKNDIFKGLPNKTLAFKDEKCFGGKKSKEKITFRVTCNMTGLILLKLLPTNVFPTFFLHFQIQMRMNHT